MALRSWLLAVLSCLVLGGAAGLRRASATMFLQGILPEHLLVKGTPVGGTQPPPVPARRSVTGSTIAVFEGDVLVVDADSGRLVRTDAGGRKLAELAIAPSVSQLVIDTERKRAYVADREGDRIVVVELGPGDPAGTGDAAKRAKERVRGRGKSPASLDPVFEFATRAEPFGLALSADGGKLLVTHVADQGLTAYDTIHGREIWHERLGAEPRGVALADDAGSAIVTFLTTGVVGYVDLLADAKPRVDYVSIDPPTRHFETIIPRGDEGRGFARNAFAAAFVGNDVAVVPHQLSTPHMPANADATASAGVYGGVNGSPVRHRLAFLQLPGEAKSSTIRTAFAHLEIHQPRALAHDPRSDMLFIAGYGSDKVVAIANVSQTTAHRAWIGSLDAGGEECGPSGIAFDERDASVVAFCSLTRKIVRLRWDPNILRAHVSTRSTRLTRSRLSSAAQRGQALFREGQNPQLSRHGSMACATCHPEGRTDGLSWLIDRKHLQTPILAGRLVGSHPFTWDGKDRNLRTTLTNAVLRLGGRGISPRQAEDLQAFLATLDAPRAPTVHDPIAAARGKELFESEQTECVDCHHGPLLTDGQTHALSSDLDAVDTPSLIGLAHSAPYFHDGSASSLDALLRGNGSIHGMGRISHLEERQIEDIIAYLRTL